MHTATAAIGVIIRLMASKPSLERRSFVWPGSGSIIGNLYMQKGRQALNEIKYIFNFFRNLNYVMKNNYNDHVTINRVEMTKHNYMRNWNH